VTASVDELRALPWAKLVAESESTSCDHLHSTLMKWFRPGTLPAEESAIWHQVEPVLGLFIQLDVGADRPFFPTDLLDSTPKDLLANLAAIASDLASDDLRARILDLAWLRKACDYKRVGECVTAYIKSAQDRLDPAHWVHAYGRLKRAIEVGASVGRNQAFLDAVAAIEAILDAGGKADPLWLSHHLMLMLRHFDAGDPAKYAALSNAIALAARAKYEANGVGNGLECERERGFLDLEIGWRRRLDDEASVRKLHLEVAEAFVRQAEGVIVANWPNAKSVATHFVECAIKRLRQVGGEATRVDALRLRLQTLQREAVAEMKGIEVTADVTQAVKKAKALVADKEPFQALCALAFAHAPPTLDDLHEEVRISAKETPFKALIPQSYLGPRGTVLVEHAGIAGQDDTTGFDFETMRTAHGRQSSVATVYFHAAAEQIRLEHGLDTPAFGQLAQASSFVPSGRERSFARGLAAGLRGDYELSTVLLIPQFEHAVRELFVRSGIVAATLPSTGAQNEYNLNQLLEQARAAEVFGAELVYDLRVLLTEKAGANLRNDIAHGLLADGGKIGAKIYFWWTCLRFVLVPLVAAQGAAEETKSEETKADDASSTGTGREGDV
jgi:hypothetical protein